MDELDIGCTAMYLPAEMAEIAAETAIFQNPMNRVSSDQAGQTGLIMPPGHLAVMTSKYWAMNLTDNLC